MFGHQRSVMSLLATDTTEASAVVLIVLIALLVSAAIAVLVSTELRRRSGPSDAYTSGAAASAGNAKGRSQRRAQ